MKHLAALATFAFSSLIPSQTITGTAAATATLQATYGGLTQTVALPAGLLASTGGQGAFAAGLAGQFARADVQWSIVGTAQVAQFRLQQGCGIAGPAPAQAAFGPGDFVLTAQAPSPMPVLLRLRQDLSIGAGMIVPILTVDVGDDGMIEYAGGGERTLPLNLTPAGVPIRVRTQVDLSVAGAINTDLFVQIVPADTLVQEVGLGCQPGGMVVEASFGGDVTLTKPQGLPFHYAWIPVLGFGIQPIVLPGPSPLCVLLPSPDVVLFAGSSSLYGFPLPPAVRPVTFWTQSVLLTPSGLVTGSTFQVDAL